MKIVYLAVDVDLSLSRGSTTHTMEVALGLENLGHEVLLYTRRGKRSSPSEEQLGDIHVRKIYRGIIMPLRESHSPGNTQGGVFSRLLNLFYAVYLRTIYSIYCCFIVLRDNDSRLPDLIIERGSCLGVGAILSFLTGVPLVAEVIDPNHSSLSLREAIGVMAYTRRVLKVDVPPHRLLLVDAAVNPENFDMSYTDSKRIKRDLGLSDSFVAGYVGIFESWHGIGTILSASEELIKDDFTFLLVGPGYENAADNIDPMARSSYRFTGGIDREEVPSYISAMDVTLAPFLETGPGMQEKGYYFSPLKIFEYAACGKPIIASDLKMIRKSLPGALLVEPGNPQELADALREVREKRVKSEVIGRKLRKIVVNQYSWKMFCERMLSRIDVWQARMD